MMAFTTYSKTFLSLTWLLVSDLYIKYMPNVCVCFGPLNTTVRAVISFKH